MPPLEDFFLGHNPPRLPKKNDKKERKKILKRVLKTCLERFKGKGTVTPHGTFKIKFNIGFLID